MIVTALSSLAKPVCRSTVCFCPAHCPQWLTSTSFVYQVYVLRYSIFSRQLFPRCPTHWALHSGCNLTLPPSWPVPQGPCWAAQIQSCLTWPPLRVFWDLVTISQVLPRFWRQPASHWTASYWLSSMFLFSLQAFPSSSLKACLMILEEGSGQSVAWPVTHVVSSVLG